MIDLLKNYRQLQNASGYVGSVRYYLAKKKMDTLFIKWMSTNREDVEKLLKKAQLGKLKASEYVVSDVENLIPYFRIIESHIKERLANCIHQEIGRQYYPRQSSQWKQQKSTAWNNLKIFQDSPEQQLGLRQSQEQKLVNQSLNSISLRARASTPVKNGQTQGQINTIFGARNDVQIVQCKKLVTDVIGLPNYFSTCLLSKCVNSKKMTKMEFTKFWKQLQSKQIQKRAFNLLSSDKNKKFLTIDDFKKLFKQILQVHPGLQFLKDSPQFQEWYSVCVINRMFFMANRKNDYQMSYREFKKSRILQSLFDIEAEPDINQNKDFFSYQDFYVIYIKFWELDNDHDFYLSKEELSKYSGYTLSRKTIERIFSQVARKFQHAEKMSFGDFCWFIYCVEDKTTDQSLEFWFKILDLDGNDIVSGYELEFFFQEQSQRLAYMDGNTDFNFENIICQMVDLMKPDNNIQFQLKDFMKRKQECGLFISFLTDLNKLVAFESRDAYEEKNEKTEHPEWTDWDRFVKPEYRRVENAGEYDDGEEMLNWEDDAL